MISLSEMLKKREEIIGEEINEEEYVNIDSSSSSSFDITRISPPVDFNTIPSSENVNIDFISTSSPENVNIDFSSIPSSDNVNTTEIPTTLESRFIFDTSTSLPTSPQFNSTTLNQEIFPEFRQRNTYLYENPVFDNRYPVRRIYTERRRGISTKKFYLYTMGGITLFLSLIILNDYLLLSGKI